MLEHYAQYEPEGYRAYHFQNHDNVSEKWGPIFCVI